MSDIKLFFLGAGQVSELAGRFALLEKDLQNLIESQLETFLCVRLLASEYSTGKAFKGRIDSLGLDENNCPVIIEYKRHSNENVINQGLFYLDWLLDHQAEFQLLVMKQLDKDVTESIEWSGTRLICIAADFNKYDEHAVQQINRNIELMRYRYFGEDLLLLELVNAQTAASSPSKVNGAKSSTQKSGASTNGKSKSTDKSQQERLAEASPALLSLYNQVCDYASGLGDEVQRREVKLYTAFKRIKNFLCIVVLPQNKDPRLLLILKLNPAVAGPDTNFNRDVTNIGHWGTGNLELSLRNESELEKTLALILKSYQAN
ncbi:MAG: putative transport protein [Motiliproteus sp.]|jgi:predicted transport protein